MSNKIFKVLGLGVELDDGKLVSGVGDGLDDGTLPVSKDGHSFAKEEWNIQLWCERFLWDSST